MRLAALTKRTAGAPLSDAEHAERVAAARARWARRGSEVVGAVVGGAGAAAIGDYGAKRLAARGAREARTAANPRFPEVSYRLTALFAARRRAAIQAAREIRESAIRRQFRRPAETEKPTRLSPVTIRVRQIRAQMLAHQKEIASIETALHEHADDWEGLSGAEERRLTQRRNVIAGSGEHMRAELDYLLGARPPKFGTRKGGLVQRRISEYTITRKPKGKAPSYTERLIGAPRAAKQVITVQVTPNKVWERHLARRVRTWTGDISPKGMASLREKLREGADAIALKARAHAEDMRHAPAWQRRAAAMLEGRYTRMASFRTAQALRWRGIPVIPAVSALLGAAAGAGLAMRSHRRPDPALRKAADDPPDAPKPVPKPPVASVQQAGDDAEEAIAARLARAFLDFGSVAEHAFTSSRKALRGIFATMTGRALEPLEAATRGGAGAPVSVETDDPDDHPRFIVFSLNTRSPRIERVVNEHRLKLAGDLADQQLATIQSVLSAAALTGQSVQATARLLRDTVGLTPTQAQHVASYRAELETLDPRALQRALRDKRFDRSVKRAIGDGMDLPGDAINKMVDIYHRRYVAYRAMTIARTEGLSAANNGHMAAVADFLDGHPGFTVVKTWIATDDDRTRPDHRGLNGQQVVGLYTPFVAPSGERLLWPHDPKAALKEKINCLLPGTRVYAEDLRAATRRPFQGDVVAIQCASGAKLTCTANHPILTERGWVGAQFLRPLDRLVRCRNRDWAAEITDDQDVPPRIEDVEHALALAVGARLTKIGTGMDFHGDGTDGEIDVVFANDDLAAKINLLLLKPGGEDVLRGTGPVAKDEARLRRRLQPIFRALDASHRGVGAPHLGLSSTLGHLAPFEDLGLTPAAQAAAVPLQNSADGRTGDPMRQREAQDRGSLIVGPEEGIEIGRGPELSREPRVVGGKTGAPHNSRDPARARMQAFRDLLRAQAAPVELDDVVFVSRFPWEGHVYNLETGTGIYLANGILSHNCRCSIGAQLVAGTGVLHSRHRGAGGGLKAEMVG